MYRDETNLAVTPHLWGMIEEALAASAYFILLASPNAAASRWVQRELEFWIAAGRAERLLIVVTAGAIVWDSERRDFDWDNTTALPRTLSGVFEEEPLYVDLTWARRDASDLSLRNAGFRGAVVGLKARISGREMHEVDSEEVRRHRGVVRLTWVAALALAMLLSIAAIVGVLLHNERRTTSSDILAASSASQLDANPERALALAVRAIEVARTPRSEFALRQAVARSPVVTFSVGELTNGSIAIAGGMLAAATPPRIHRLMFDTAAQLPPVKGEMNRGGHAFVHQDRDALEVGDVATGRPVYRLPGETFDTFSTDGTLLVTSAGGTRRVHRVHDGLVVASVPVTKTAVRDAALSRDATRLVIAFEERPPMILTLATARTVVLPRIPGTFTYSAAFDPTGERVVFGTDKGISICTADGRFLRDLVGRGERAEQFAFSPDGRRLIAACGDAVARIWSWPKGELLASLAGDIYGVGEATFSADGRVIATATYGGGVQLWHGTNYRRLATFGGTTDPVASAVFDNSRHLLVVAHTSGMIRAWDIDDYAPVRNFSRTGAYVVNAAIDDRGRRIAIGVDETAHVFDAGSGAALHAFRESRLLLHVALSRNGNRIATAATNGIVSIWPLVPNEAPRRIHAHERDSNWAEFSPDDSLLATSGSDGTIALWSTARLLPVRRIGTIPNAVRSVRFRHDGSRIVAACGDNVARIWSIDGKLVRNLRGHTDIVNSAAFSPDGTRIVTASDDGTSRVWDAETGEAILILRHSDPVRCADFSPDGALIVTATGVNPVVAKAPPDGNVARIWDAATGQLVQEIRAHASLVSSAVFAGDGSVLTGSWDDVASLFHLSSTGNILRVLEEGQHRVARNASTTRR